MSQNGKQNFISHILFVTLILCVGCKDFEAKPLQSGVISSASTIPFALTAAETSVSVNIWYPTPNLNIAAGQLVSLAGSATSSKGTVSVINYYINGSFACSAQNQGSCSYKVSSSAGTYIVIAKATDSKGNTGQASTQFTIGGGSTASSSSNLVSVSIWYPTINMTIPASQWVSFAGMATGSVATSKIDYAINGAFACSAANSGSCSYQLPSVAGVYHLTATAKDAAGNQIGQALRDFTISVSSTASAPVVTTSPTPAPTPSPTIPSSSGIKYYVSPTGNDSNDGKSSSTPWQSIAKVNAATFMAGDSVLFQGGQNFYGCLKFSASNVLNSSSSNPFTVDSYGSGSFNLTATCTGAQAAAIEINGVSGFTLQHAHLIGNSGGTAYGVYLHNLNGTASASGITIANNDIGGFFIPASTSNNFGGEIFMTGDGPLSNIKIIGNTLHGLNGAASPDDNGISGWGSNKNIKNVLYQANTLYNIGGKANGYNGCEGNGIIANGVDGAVMENNVAHDLGGNVNTCGGAAAFWAASANNVTIQHNEAYFVRPVSFTSGCDWDGYDLDLDVTNSTVQYNYSHDNFGDGYLLYGSGSWGGSTGNTIRFNISQNDGAGIGIGGDSNTTMPFQIYNNTIFQNPGGTNPQNDVVTIVSSINPQGVIANNIFYQYANFYGNSRMLNENGMTYSGVKFANNIYFSPSVGQEKLMFNSGGNWYYGLNPWQAAGNDVQGKFENPALANPGSAGICGGYSPSCLSGYVLQSGSPALGAGVDLSQAPYYLNVGTQNFFGNSLPARSNIGAY